ncbi:MAG: CBS domain-containing protein [Candidatus Neomarinimicrobiota bacterium]
MFDGIDDELRQMDEREQESPELKRAVQLEDPISALELGTPITVRSSTSVQEAFNLMAENDIGCLLVTDDDGKLLGIITERDMLRKACGACEKMAELHVGNYMTESPDTLQSEDPMAFALNRMCEHHYRHVPIVDDELAATGVVSMRDVVRHVGLCFHKEISNLPPEPVHRMRRQIAG